MRILHKERQETFRNVLPGYKYGWDDVVSNKIRLTYSTLYILRQILSTYSLVIPKVMNSFNKFTYK